MEINNFTHEGRKKLHNKATQPSKKYKKWTTYKWDGIWSTNYFTFEKKTNQAKQKNKESLWNTATQPTKKNEKWSTKSCDWYGVCMTAIRNVCILHSETFSTCVYTPLVVIMHTHTHTHASACTHTQTHTHMHTHVSMHVHTDTPAYFQASVQMTLTQRNSKLFTRQDYPDSPVICLQWQQEIHHSRTSPLAWF